MWERLRYSDKQKLRESIAIIFILPEMVKGVLEGEMKGHQQ